MRLKLVLAGCFALTCVLTGSGCTTFGPQLGFVAAPIPVSPYYQKAKEDKFWNHERYDRTAVLGPLTPGAPIVALDEPSDDEVLRALEKAEQLQGGIPLFYEVQRNNILIQKEKIADFVDPPRFYPVVGPAQLHHARWKCTVYFTRVTHVGWPLPHTLTDEDAAQVLYIDHSHLHMCGDVDTGPGSNF